MESFWKNHCLKLVDVCQITNSQCVQNLLILRKKTRRVLERNLDSFFYYSIFGIAQSQHLIARASKGSDKTSFAIKLFHFCETKKEQCYIHREEMNISKTELNFLVENLRVLLKTFDKASNSLQIALPKPKGENGSTKSKDNPFAQYYKDIIEHPKRQTCLPFRFGKNNSCAFFIKNFDLHRSRFILTKIVKLNHG